MGLTFTSTFGPANVMGIVSNQDQYGSSVRVCAWMGSGDEKISVAL